MTYKKQIKNFVFFSESENEVAFEGLQNENGITEVKISVNFKQKQIPEPLVIKWTYPCKNVFSQWNPALNTGRALNPVWRPIKNNSRSAEGMPIQTHLSLDGKNIITVSLDDPLTPMEIETAIIEETAEISYRLTLFKDRISPISVYETVLRIDTRKKSYFDIIDETAKKWSNVETKIPEECNMPMYSTWYSYHQMLNHEELIEELRLAKEYGMESVIIDDGWQTNDGQKGYAYCGDWKSIRIPDMKKLVSDVHDVGMKCLVWFAIPFVGIHSEAWEKFQGKFLNQLDENNPWCVLDPRYPDVREYLINICKNAVSEWGIDGLKIDFIDRFRLTEYSSLPDSNMDFESLEDAITCLLREIKENLIAVDPDIMIEFRQPYTGPIMRKCGNMLRVVDCPMDAVKNRAGIVDLKMIAGNTAVHSDMLMWNYADTPEAAALQIINVFFGVPQISVLIEKLPDKHKRVLKFYLSLWIKYRECIINGKLKAENPEAGYSIVSCERAREVIAVAYIKNILKLTQNYEKIIYINGSWERELFINNYSCEYDVRFKIYDCMGSVTDQGEITLRKGITGFKVPHILIMDILAIENKL